MAAGSVTNYQAGLETTNTQVSYAMETAWSTVPVATFQAIRMISESLKHVKTRTRPGEIRGDRQAAPAITTQEVASGSLVFPIYYLSGTSLSPFDDFMSALMGNDWQVPTTINEAAADMVGTIVGGNLVLTSGAGKYTGVKVNSIVKLSGFTNAVNNSFYRVLSNTGAIITLIPQGFTPIAETPAGTAGKLYYSNLTNSTFFKSIYLQQKLNPAATMWFRYPGAYTTRGQVTLSLGQFLQATFDITAQQELKGLVDGSSGGIIPAPNTNNFDPVGGFKGVYFNDVLLASGVDQFTLDLNNDGAAGQYALGSALAQGMLGGTFTASGSFRIYIKDMTLYDAFRSETAGVLRIHAGDKTGNSYSWTFPNAILLLNDGVNVDGPNRSMMGTFALEASPDTSGGSGITCYLDRFPFTA